MPTPTPTEFNPLAGLAAAIFPGAGHLVLGRPRRAVLAMAGVMGLFMFGLLIGGVDAVDRREDFVWFLGQSLVGPPTFIVDRIHQTRFKAYDMSTGQLRNGYPNEHRVDDGARPVWEPMTHGQIDSGMAQPITPGLGRLNEIAMLSIVLAGMLNLVVFLDALMPSAEKTAAAPRPVSRPVSRPVPQSGGA